MTSGKTAIVVTGDANRNKVLTVPGGGMTTVKIELPNNWDELMKELGYQPLSSYNLKSTSAVSQTNNAPIPTNSVSENVQKNQTKPQNYSSSNTSTQQGQAKKPSAEQYRKMMQEKRSSGSSGQVQQRQQNAQSQRRPQGQTGQTQRRNPNGNHQRKS